MQGNKKDKIRQKPYVPKEKVKTEIYNVCSSPKACTAPAWHFPASYNRRLCSYSKRAVSASTFVLLSRYSWEEMKTKGAGDARGRWVRTRMANFFGTVSRYNGKKRRLWDSERQLDRYNPHTNTIQRDSAVSKYLEKI